jgi:hypothetical protein
MKRRLLSSFIGLALFGCGSNPGDEPRASPQRIISGSQTSTLASAEAPRETVNELQVCVNRHAPGLSSDSYAILFDLEATKSGQVTAVKIKDSMVDGSDVEACITNVLKQMDASVATNMQHGATPQSRSVVGIVQAAAAPIALLPIALVAGGVTILLGVTIYVATGNVTVDDVLDAARRRRPKPTKNRCLDAAAGGQFLWYELCRAIAITDEVKAQGCWALAEDGSEEQKRNWCNGVKF